MPVSWEHRLQLLREMGNDPTDDNAIQAELFRLDAKPWLSWLQPLHIMTRKSSEYLDIRVRPDQLDRVFNWAIATEHGECIDGECVPATLEEVGDYYIDGIRYTARRLVFQGLPAGYHQISMTANKRTQTASLIVAPQGCYNPLESNEKIWGLNCQLYTLRSDRNWGIGDFTDLAELIELAAAAGMDMLALNPMHAPCSSEMNIASPYSPSDRRFLNPLYLDPEQVPDFLESVVRDDNRHEQIQREISSLREPELIDYDAVARLKYSVYDEMFQYFRDHHLAPLSERGNEFMGFVQQNEPLLSDFSRFESRCFGLSIPSASDPRFHQYLQWLTETQLSDCQQLARQMGMRIGLMKDLAVGAVVEGAEVQGNPELFCKRATIGAPPDPLAEHGQNWNLPALDPQALKTSGYELFTSLLRANMHSCGGLRIDHILGLLRLWWCLPDSDHGAYVYYPLEDLLAIICLESQRNKCLVVGEDMGTVPSELRQAMSEKSIYGNRLFYFEKQYNRAFTPPQSHQPHVLLMVTNHDVPTLAGWWDASDLGIRKEIGLIQDQDEYVSACKGREQEKQECLNWLQSQQLLPESWHDCTQDKRFDFDLCSAILIANARSRSALMLFQLDDLQLLHRPVNIPGTWKQYPNWRRRQKLSTRELFGQSGIQKLLSDLHQARIH